MKLAGYDPNAVTSATRRINTPYSPAGVAPTRVAAPAIAPSGKGYTPRRDELQATPFTPKWGTQVPTDEQGRPLTPEFATTGDTGTGLLRPQYNIQNILDRQVLERGREEALRQPGVMSKWGQMALSQAQNQMASQLAGQQAQAQNQLAMQGGLRSGARERLASQGLRQQMIGGQQALGGVQAQDEATRQKWMQMMPGMELQAAQYCSDVQSKNIDRALQEIAQQRLLKQRQYEEAMRGWAAGTTASAAKSDESGGLLSDIFNAIF